MNGILLNNTKIQKQSLYLFNNLSDKTSTGLDSLYYTKESSLAMYFEKEISTMSRL